MNKVVCLGHNGEVNASDMIKNYQHKHHICKSCHADIAQALAKENAELKAKSIAEHDKAAVDALMGDTKPVKKSKARPSLYQAIDSKRDAMEMAKLVRGDL